MTPTRLKRMRQITYRAQGQGRILGGLHEEPGDGFGDDAFLLRTGPALNERDAVLSSLLPTFLVSALTPSFSDELTR